MHVKPRRAVSLLAALCLFATLLCPVAGLAAADESPALEPLPEEAFSASAPDGAVLIGTADADDGAAAPTPANPDAAADAQMPQTAPLPAPEEEEAGEPAFDRIGWNYENGEGCTFTVSAHSTDPAVQEADALVWTRADRADAVRVNAQQRGSVWSAGIDIGAFHYLCGTYSVQMIGRNSSGLIVAESAICQAEIEPEETEFAVRWADAVGSRYRLTLSGALLPGRPDVWFEIHNEAGSLVSVLAADRTETAYTAVFPASALGAPGSFTLTACSGHQGECRTELASTAFEADRLTYAGLSLSADGSQGTFSYELHAQSPLGITDARIAVWSDKDQQDIVWMDMIPASGGFTSPVLSVRDFSGFSTYTAHTYVRLGDGSEVLAAGLEAVVLARDCIWSERAAGGRYNILVEGPSARTDLRVAVWSETNGQDDLVWYPCSLEDDGIYMATALTSRHADGGLWFAHVYSGDALLGGTSFRVAESDMLSPAEQRIAAGCERVYNAAGTDLHSVYLWVVNNLSYVRRVGHLSPPAGYTREQWYAVEGLEEQTGNCYTYAATFCELARGLGYDATYVEGDVYGVGQKWWPHGFVLIEMDGSTYICDPELQYASSAGRNLYMQPISSPRATYRW